MLCEYVYHSNVRLVLIVLFVCLFYSVCLFVNEITSYCVDVNQGFSRCFHTLYSNTALVEGKVVSP